MALTLGKRSIRRVMRKYGIRPYKRLARWRKRLDLRRPPADFPNLVKRICPIRPNVIYVSDFTYLKYQGKYIYLATLMDLYTREIVGWDISVRHTRELVVNALMDAIATSNLAPKIVHSDQGVEYNSQGYTNLAKSLGIQVSMSRKQSPWENGYQESFFSNFKTDLGLEFDRFNTVGELIEAIHQTINYYNKERIHTTLKMSPAKFHQVYERNHLERLYCKPGT